MSASGSSSLTVNNFALSAQPVPDQPFVFFHGQFLNQVPFGDGFLCIGPPIVRLLPAGFATGYLASRPVDLATEGFMPGTYYFQCWFRDPGIGGSGYNLSDALEVQFVP